MDLAEVRGPDDDGDGIEHATEESDLPGQALERVLLALDLEPVDLAVNDGDVDPSVALANAELVQDQGIGLVGVCEAEPLVQGLSDVHVAHGPFSVRIVAANTSRAKYNVLNRQAPSRARRPANERIHMSNEGRDEYTIVVEGGDTWEALVDRYPAGTSLGQDWSVSVEFRNTNTGEALLASVPVRSPIDAESLREILQDELRRANGGRLPPQS